VNFIVRASSPLPPFIYAQCDRGPQPSVGWRPRSGREIWDLVPFRWTPVGVNPTGCCKQLPRTLYAIFTLLVILQKCKWWHKRLCKYFLTDSVETVFLVGLLIWWGTWLLCLPSRLYNLSHWNWITEGNLCKLEHNNQVRLFISNSHYNKISGLLYFLTKYIQPRLEAQISYFRTAYWMIIKDLDYIIWPYNLFFCFILRLNKLNY
jgi:hypothetical protein